MLPKMYQKKVSLKTTVPKCCSKHCLTKHSWKISVAECCQKTYLEKVSLKTTIRKCCSKDSRSNHLSNISVAECCQTIVAKNNRTKKLLRKLPLWTFVKHIRRRMLPERVPRKSVVKKQPYRSAARKTAGSKHSSNKSVAESCEKSTRKKCR